ncbi:MAG: tetratricopeptide repeat protein [Prevotellaceae bacterium]|jgi:tetratricopeptide (TPR) repeat protein|nr:tetratricopeptide repeat protein [Prevotellaceae bacterium]
MKKLLTGILLLLLNVCIAFSQKFEKRLAASDRDIAHITKGANPKTWIARGKLFYDIANSPVENLMAGMSENSYKVAIQGETLTETVETIGEKKYKVHTFPDKKIYLASEMLMFWDILKYEVPDPLRKSYEAYQRAKILDRNGKNSKKTAEGLGLLAILAKSEAFNKYYAGKLPEAIELFRLSIDCSSDSLVGEIDSLGYYFVGVIASDTGRDSIAEKYLRKAINAGYTDKGDAYAYLGKTLMNLERPNEAREVLEKGFARNPDNHQLIFSLINNYMVSGRDPREIIPLIKKAQKAEPNNPGLYTVEGQLYEKTDDLETAIECFRESIEIDPDYFYGYSALGLLHFNSGAKYTEQAIAERDNAEYERLLNRADEQLKLALPFLEKALDLSKDNTTLAQPVIRALRDINFHFRYENDTFKENAEKYSKLLNKQGEN